MQLYPGYDNYVQLGNIHIFVNFTQANLDYVMGLNNSERHIFHIFITRNDIPENNHAFKEFLRYRVAVRKINHKPANVTVYGPEWYSYLTIWINSVVSTVNSSVGIHATCGSRFKVGELDSTEIACIRYPEKFEPPCYMTLGYETVDPDGNYVGCEPIASYLTIESRKLKIDGKETKFDNGELRVGDIVHFNIVPGPDGTREFSVGSVESILLDPDGIKNRDICLIVQPDGTKIPKYFNEDIALGTMIRSRDYPTMATVADKVVRAKDILNTVLG